ncbi:hypothetical protein [Streptomyces sp. SID12501]|uniref:Uncharacterized protein n=1 Tax=Streptomyces sp. SID12501 TaxID=2706042 RepID=A0A6B3BW66_9ACTN|nr:hypothetical protein [Streptomyces sp. SID12501]NEC88486.1 hypothetical protein [Streptomyces sp. SID12501]
MTAGIRLSARPRDGYRRIPRVRSALSLGAAIIRVTRHWMPWFGQAVTSAMETSTA